MKRKSVAIISLLDNNVNYGGFLQAYALTYLLNTHNYSAEQLLYPFNPPTASYLWKSIAKEKAQELSKAKNCYKFFDTVINFFYGSFYSFLQNHYVVPGRKIRLANFEKFKEHYIPTSKKYTLQSISPAADNYDIFLSGSDQVWNPFLFDPSYYLHFVPDNKPKISYAASVAVSAISPEQEELMKPLISRFDALSVREENAIQLLGNMTDKKVTLVLDPTLLLTRSEWDSIAGPKRLIKSPYIVTYILGDNKRNRKAVLQFAKKKHLKLVAFPYVSSIKLWQRSFGDIHCYGGPEAFVSLIRDAEYVITDSYHAAVFSIIYHKKFVVVKRDSDSSKVSMNARMYSLFQLIGMERQFCSPEEIDERIDTISYRGIEELIARNKEESLTWLMNSLAGEYPK